jgi:hypothetical protein
LLRHTEIDPIVAYVALPMAVLTLLLGIAYWRARARESVPACAARWAVAAAGLALVAWALTVVQQIAVSGSSTAFLEIILIGPIGLLLAVLAFIVVWGLAVVGQWVLAPSRRRPDDRWALPFAWLIVVLAGGVGTTLGYSAHLYEVASGAASPSTLRELSQQWWTSRDATVREALAQNPRTPPDVLAELAWKPAIRALVASNPAVPPAELERMYIDPGTRVGLARNPSTPAELLRRLATEPDPGIRWPLLGNPALPDDVLAQLERDRDGDIGLRAASEARRRREGSRWTIVSPPYTWRWRNPFRRVFDDGAPADTWHRVQTFDTEEGCEALRAENVRRERYWRGRLRESWKYPTDRYSHARCALLRP